MTGNEARTKLRDLLDEVAYNDSHIHVSRYDRPIAVIVSAAWYKRAAAVTLTSAKTGEQR